VPFFGAIDRRPLRGPEGLVPFSVLSTGDPSGVQRHLGLLVLSIGDPSGVQRDLGLFGAIGRRPSGVQRHLGLPGAIDRRPPAGSTRNLNPLI